MKAIKFFVAAMAMAFAMNANAQVVKDGHFMVNVNLGAVTGGGASQGAFGIGVGYETRELLETSWISLAWDVAQFEWNAPFNSPSNLDFLSLKTGARAFSPSFAKGHLRAYTNLAMGYTCVLTKQYELDWDWDDDDVDVDEKMKAHHGFGLTWGIGLQYNKKFSWGYSLQYETAFKMKNHFFTMAYTF